MRNISVDRYTSNINESLFFLHMIECKLVEDKTLLHSLIFGYHLTTSLCDGFLFTDFRLST